MPAVRVEVRDLCKVYHGRRILNDVRLSLDGGDTLGIMGPSGAGKTTLGRLMVGMERPTGGSVVWDGHDIADPGVVRKYRRKVQMVVQDPTAALNPLKTVRTLLREIPAPRRNRSVSGEQRFIAALHRVGLDPEILSCRPTELSGGMNQRLFLARVLLLEPGLIVFDEPTAALDLSLQAAMLHLIRDLKARFGFSYVLISHAPDVVRFMCRRVVTLADGGLHEET